MAEKFVVYVFAPPEGEAEAAGNKLAELLKLEPSKVRASHQAPARRGHRPVSGCASHAPPPLPAGGLRPISATPTRTRCTPPGARDRRIYQRVRQRAGWADESGDGADWQPDTEAKERRRLRLR